MSAPPDVTDPLLFTGKCNLNLRRSDRQAYDEITVVASDAKDAHGTQTRQKNIGSIIVHKTRYTVCAKKCFFRTCYVKI